MIEPQIASKACGCPEFSQSRRDFLRNVLSVAGAGFVASIGTDTFLHAAFADATAAPSRNILVVVSLRGGADGLSLVVPYSDPQYAPARGNIAIPTGSLLKKDATFGLHPSFAPLSKFWDDGRFTAVHATGLEAPNRSHFAAMEELEDADPGSTARRGWINRLIGLDGGTPSPIEGVQMGSPLVPTSLWGKEPTIAVTTIHNMYLPGRSQEDAYERRVSSLRRAWRQDTSSYGVGARAAIDLSIDFEDLVDTLPPTPPAYPEGEFGAAMAETAHLIRGEIGARVIAIDSGTWDMHIDIGHIDHGLMKNAVDQLAQGIRAFFDDLGSAYADRVTLVTITEFGRRVEVNDGGGLDHGWANAMLVLGAGVNGGKYFAHDWPGLGDLRDGDLKMTTDYRAVLGKIVKYRFGVDPKAVFPGISPTSLNFMRAT